MQLRFAQADVAVVSFRNSYTSYIITKSPVRKICYEANIISFVFISLFQ